MMRWAFSTLLGLTPLLMHGFLSAADSSGGKRVKDRGKYSIESPLKKLVAAQPVPAKVSVVKKVKVPKDVGKGRIEKPLKKLVAQKAALQVLANAKKKATARSTGNSDGFRNPKVQPGKVKWHADFDKAVAAAGESGKPVLLFQMIGRLDERFS